MLALIVRRSQTAVDQGFQDVRIEWFGEKAVAPSLSRDALTSRGHQDHRDRSGITTIVVSNLSVLPRL